MYNMNNSQQSITSALEELVAELGASEATFGGKLKIEGKDPVVASRHHIGDPNGASQLDWSVFTKAAPEH